MLPVPNQMPVILKIILSLCIILLNVQLFFLLVVLQNVISVFFLFLFFLNATLQGSITNPLYPSVEHSVWHIIHTLCLWQSAHLQVSPTPLSRSWLLSHFSLYILFISFIQMIMKYSFIAIIDQTYYILKKRYLKGSCAVLWEEPY